MSNPALYDVAVIGNPTLYDVAVIGGGLGGLSLSIGLALKGYRVVLLEKETYPFHRVCGEYISMESRPFLQRLGLPLDALGLPQIHTLTVTAPDGFRVTHPLSLGGFGISRYTLDALLAERARAVGVDLRTGTRVNRVTFTGEGFELESNGLVFRARVAVGSFGKRSNLDIGMQRSFTRREGGKENGKEGGKENGKERGKENNYVGIKYHIRMPLPKGHIALHNFSDGYCGVSEVDGGVHCLCYLTTAANLVKSGGSIARMEKEILQQNPHLKEIFDKAEFLWAKPETIAQISFQRKAAVEQHLLMTGDAAGMISPLCGNGMSMALRSGVLALDAIAPFLQGTITREELETRYARAWKKHFATRMEAGRIIQSFFGKPGPTKLFLQLLKPFPKFIEQIIRRTHGKTF